MIRRRCSRAGAVLLLPLLVLNAACRSSGGSGPRTGSKAGKEAVEAHAASPGGCSTVAPPPYRPTAEQAERDDILSLLAYAVVSRTWQPTCSPVGDACPTSCRTSRGYNIGAVLAKLEQGKPQILCWGLNSVYRTRNWTQHGEVRLITNYLEGRGAFNKVDAFVYTTLEPCAMCAGMMTLTGVGTTIYGQADPGYGEAIGRLVLNSTALPHGFCPYPRGVVSARAPGRISSALAGRLEAGFAAYRQRCRDSITDWLSTPEAEAIFAEAPSELSRYAVQFPANAGLLEAARRFLEGVPARDGGYLPIPYQSNCPPS